jgi:hypothetical protein
MLIRQPVFITAAGYVGPKARVDHDVSLLVPEVWSRMTPEERTPEYLIKNECLERVPDIEFEGRLLPSSRLGWRINSRFVRMFFGRIFNYPHRVFTPEMLQPESQGLDAFADGMDNIAVTQKQVAEAYFADGGIDMACPPLHALLHIMRDGHFENKTLNDPEVRNLFDPAAALASDWYRKRLEAAAAVDRDLWLRHVKNLETFTRRPHNAETIANLGLAARLEYSHRMLARVRDSAYSESLRGTIGAQPLK